MVVGIWKALIQGRGRGVCFLLSVELFVSEAKAGGARGWLRRHFRAISAGFSASEIPPAFEIPRRLLLGDRLARFPCTHTQPPPLPAELPNAAGMPREGAGEPRPFQEEPALPSPAPGDGVPEPPATGRGRGAGAGPGTCCCRRFSLCTGRKCPLRCQKHLGLQMETCSARKCHCCALANYGFGELFTAYLPAPHFFSPIIKKVKSSARQKHH